MVDCHELEEEWPPEDVVVANVKFMTLNINISLRLLSPDP
jgi:hypothetical protein